MLSAQPLRIHLRCVPALSKIFTNPDWPSVLVCTLHKHEKQPGNFYILIITVIQSFIYTELDIFISHDTNSLKRETDLVSPFSVMSHDSGWFMSYTDMSFHIWRNPCFRGQIVDKPVKQQPFENCHQCDWL